MFIVAAGLIVVVPQEIAIGFIVAVGGFLPLQLVLLPAEENRHFLL